MGGDLQTTIHFLARDPLYETVKPYSIRYPPRSTIQQSNIISNKPVIDVHDIRDAAREPQLDECGFQVMKLVSSMRYEDFSDRGKITDIYQRELAQALRATLGATHVYVLDAAVRRRHISFPISTGKDYEDEQPTNMAHIDFTREEGERMIHILYGRTEATRIMQSRWQVINAWRPLRGPLNDWPLGVCDASTVNYTADTMPSDIVYEGWVTENMQVHHTETQKWYYLSRQMPSEVLIFKSAESEIQHYAGIPHAGIYNPKVGPNDLRRESIDCRCLVFYAPLTPFPPEVADPLSPATFDLGEPQHN